MVVNSTSQLLIFCIQPVGKPVVKLAKLDSLPQNEANDIFIDWIIFGKVEGVNGFGSCKIQDCLADRKDLDKTLNRGKIGEIT